MAEFSIIVPVYKVEKYLSTCVESVLGQTYADFELVLVDDGSPDDCGRICDDYTRQDQRVRVVHKENGGLSSARNAGLDVAEGRYVIFLDSDDFWDDINALENIHKQLAETDADVLVFPLKRYYEVDDRYTYALDMTVDRSAITDSDLCSAIRYMIENNVFRAAAWNKVVRKSIIDDHEMRFLKGYLSEDMDWCGNLLVYAKRFDFYANPLYVYRQQRAGSITQQKNEKLVSDKLFMCRKGLEQAQSMPDKERGALLAAYYAYEYAVTLGVSDGVKDREILSQMKALRPLLRYDLCRKVKMVNKLIRLCGYSLARKALCLFVKVKR